MTDCRGAAWSL